MAKPIVFYSRFIFVLLFYFHSIVCSASNFELKTLENISNSALPSIVTISLADENNCTSVVLSQSNAEDVTSSTNYNSPPQFKNYGSGFIINKKGYILTAAHLIKERSNCIDVKLYDGRLTRARLVFSDLETDIAIIHIPDNNLHPLVLDTTNMELRVGQDVLSIGSPYFFENSISTGVISHLSRNLTSDHNNTSLEYIQTNIPINPGNSGGPVLNADGKVIGMNTRIFSPTGSSIGISFAVPSNIIADRLSYLITDELIINGQQKQLSVTTSDVSEMQVSYFGLADAVGARITYIATDSYPEHLGLQTDDIIVTLNNQVIKSSSDFTETLASLNPETPVKLTAIRFGHYLSTTITPKFLYSGSL